MIPRRGRAIAEAKRRKSSAFSLDFKIFNTPKFESSEHIIDHRWKMALLTWIGVWPISWLIGAAIGPHLAAMPAFAGSALIAAAIVVCLTWAVMPALVRLFKGWLN